MKSTIAINNALKYYNETTLVSGEKSLKEAISDDICEVAYDKLLDNICRKHFIPRWAIKNN